MRVNRRDALRLCALSHPCRAWQAGAGDRPAAAGGAPGRVRLAVSTYSYWHFKESKYPVERVIADAARLGFDGVEILHRQMDGESPEYVNRLKQAAFRGGLAMPMLSIHQDFVSPDAKERQTAIDHTRRCIELAARLGIPAVRLNSGRWKTIKSFDDLMKVKGEEPPLPGLHAAGCVRLVHREHPRLPAGRRAPRRGARAREPLGPHHRRRTPAPHPRRRRPHPGSGSTSTPATSRATRMPASNGSRRTQPSCRRRPTMAAASGTRSISITRGSPGSCGRPASAGGYRWRWKARSRPRPPCPRAWPCSATRSAA